MEALAISTSAEIVFASDDSGRSEYQFFAFELKECGKGLGAFASGSYSQGERIFSERPLAMLIVPSREHVIHAEGRALIERVVESLTEKRRAAYFSLSQEQSRFGLDPTPLGIWMSNAYPCGSNDHSGDRQGVFEQICRINHACNPNCTITWNARLRRLTVHAARRIAPGEELTVSFYGEEGREGMMRAERQARLRAKFGFDCACELCGLRDAALARSEKRQQRLQAIGSILEQATVPYQRMRSLAQEASGLLRDEGLPASWGKVWMLKLVSSAADAEDADAAGRWAQKAAKCAREASGVDSAEYMAILQ